MEAHTPKRYAVEKFIKGQGEHAHGWHVRVIDEQETPVVRLEAVNQDSSAADKPKRLEIHTRQITLENDELDSSTRKMISRWLDSLSSGEPAAPASFS
jgi:hypothetical protein